MKMAFAKAIPGRFLLAVGIFASAVCLTISVSPVSKALRDRVGVPLEFFARRLLGGAPILDPRLKIFALDDASTHKLGATDLSLEDWSAVIVALDAAGASTVVIDKLFDGYFGDEAAERFVSRTKDLSLRIVTIGFVADREVMGRTPLESTQLSTALGVTDEMRRYAYGRAASLRGSLRIVGHANNAGLHYVRPVETTSSGQGLAHVAFAALNSLERAVRVQTDRQGRIGLDMPEATELARRTYGLAPLVLDARTKRPIPVVKHGDVVLILPAFQTGHADLTDTPVGSIPGGYRLAAALDAGLSERFVRQWDHPELMALLGTSIGALVAVFLPIAATVGVTMLGMGLLAAVGVLCFTFVATQLPWEMTALSWGVTAAAIVGRRAFEQALAEQRRTTELAVAALVQNAFLRQGDHSRERLRILAWSRAASECGGDFWFVRHGSRQSYIVLADATGHGTPAALLTSMMFAGLDAEIEPDGADAVDLSKLFERLSSTIHRAMAGEMFVAAFGIAIDRATGQVSIVNGGMPAPLTIARVADSPVKLRARGDLLGASDKVALSSHPYSLSTGDVYLLFTDGVYEVTDERGKVLTRSRFENRLRAALADQPLTPECVLAEAKHIFESCTRQKEAEDDATLIVMSMGA